MSLDAATLTTVKQSYASCGLLCYSESCNTFSYNKDTGECKLFELTPSMMNVTDDSNSDVWAIRSSCPVGYTSTTAAPTTVQQTSTESTTAPLGKYHVYLLSSLIQFNPWQCFSVSWLLHWHQYEFASSEEAGGVWFSRLNPGEVHKSMHYRGLSGRRYCFTVL